MVESRRCVAFVGTVVGGPGASWPSPTHGTPFPIRPLHAWLVWCCPACLLSVQCLVFFSAAVWLVNGSMSRLMVGLCGVVLIALQPAPAQPDVVLFVFSVGSEVCCGRAVRCGGHCVATGMYPARCVGSPSTCPPVVGLSGVVWWLVWAWPVALGRPLRCLFPVGCVLSLVHLWRVRVCGCCVVASTLFG